MRDLMPLSIPSHGYKIYFLVALFEASYHQFPFQPYDQDLKVEVSHLPPSLLSPSIGIFPTNCSLLLPRGSQHGKSDNRM